MKITRTLARTLFFLTIPLLAFNYSCGDSGDDSTVIIDGGGGTQGGSPGGDDPQNEESSECLTNTQRSNIRTFLDKVSSISPFEGSAHYRVLNSDGSISEIHFDQGIYSFTKLSDSSWSVTGGLCSTSEGTCQETFATLTMRDGCFYYDNDQARIVSTSSSRVRISTSSTENGVVNITNSLASLSSGIVRINEDFYSNGVWVGRSRFVSKPIASDSP